MSEARQMIWMLYAQTACWLIILIIVNATLPYPVSDVKNYELAKQLCQSVGTYISFATSTRAGFSSQGATLWLPVERRKSARWIWSRDGTAFVNRKRQLSRPDSLPGKACVRIRAGDEVALDSAVCSRPMAGGAICSGPGTDGHVNGSAVVNVTFRGQEHHLVIIPGNFNWYQASNECNRRNATLASHDALENVSNKEIYDATTVLVDRGILKEESSYWIGLVAEGWYRAGTNSSHATIMQEYHWCSGHPDQRYNRVVLVVARACWKSVSMESYHGVHCEAREITTLGSTKKQNQNFANQNTNSSTSYAHNPTLIVIAALLVISMIYSIVISIAYWKLKRSSTRHVN